MNKILTIIIPTYNMEKYLRRCLDSLIIDEEGMKQLEVLVINDGSKDSSSQIAHEYQDKYPDTFRVIDKENGNYGSCINRGLSETTGKYVKVLDADDRYETSALASVINLLMEIDVDLFVTDVLFENPDNIITGRESKSFIQNQIFRFEDEFEHLMRCLIPMHSILYKTNNLKNIAYKQTEGISYTDTEWCIIPISTVQKVYYYPKVLYKYLLGREGQTVEKMTMLKRTPQRMQICLRLIKELDRLPNDYNEKQIQYIRLQIKCIVLEIYESLIIDYPSFFNKDILSNFDAEIKSIDNKFYEDLASVLIKKYYPIKFIKVWRENNGRIPFCISLYAWLKKIKNRNNLTH